MTISENMETQISNKITAYGNSVTIQKQTASYNASYNEVTPNWINSTTTSATAIILPFNPKTANGEEVTYAAQGTLRDDDYIGWFKATETIEESAHTGSSETRYLINFNSRNYEIIKLFPFEFQDNTIMKKTILRELTT